MRLNRVNYQGGDTAQFIHNNKTHRTASEAFRDADYATALWKCQTEWDRTKEYLVWIVLWGAVFGALYLMAVWAQKVLP